MQDRLKWSSPATFLLELVPAADNGSITFRPSFEEVQQILDNAVEEAVKAVCGIPRQGNTEAPPPGSLVCRRQQADIYRNRSVACPGKANNTWESTSTDHQLAVQLLACCVEDGVIEHGERQAKYSSMHHQLQARGTVLKPYSCLIYLACRCSGCSCGHNWRCAAQHSEHEPGGPGSAGSTCSNPKGTCCKASSLTEGVEVHEPKC